LWQNEQYVNAEFPLPEKFDRFSWIPRSDHLQSRKVGGILQTAEVPWFMSGVVNQ
jgi:hypothetical protein